MRRISQPAHQLIGRRCEFYWAYADYDDLMKFTEELLSQV